MRLRLNPRAAVTFQREEGVVTACKLSAPIRNEGLRVSRIEKASDPEFFRWLLFWRIADAKGWSHDFPASLRARLKKAGLLIREEQIARPVSFCSDLTPDLFALVPGRSRTSLVDHPQSRLIVNPSLRFLGTSETATESSELALCARRLRSARFWYLVSAPEQYAPRLYSCTARQDAELRALEPGAPAPRIADPDWLALLFGAEILVTPEHMRWAAGLAEAKFAAARAEIEVNRHCVLGSVIHPFQLAALRRYYRELVEEGYLVFGDEEWPLRFFSGNDAIAAFYQGKIQSVIRRVTGEEAKPTFLYVASYRPGARLPAHRDREECEYAVSLLLDFVPEPEGASPWPMFVEHPRRPREPIPIHLGIGDMLLYRGLEVTHYRNAFKEGRVSTTWLFFYQASRRDGRHARCERERKENRVRFAKRRIRAPKSPRRLSIDSEQVIQITRRGVRKFRFRRNLAALRRQFESRHHLRLPRVLAPDLLARIARGIDGAEFYERIHERIGPNSELCLRDDRTLALLHVLVNGEELLRTLSEITSCGPIGCFTGRVYRMASGAGHHDAWHSDFDGRRLLGMTINLGTVTFRGGLLQMRDSSSRQVIEEIANTGFGDAVVFRIAPGLEHRITDVEGAPAKTAFAGWFLSEPAFASLLRRAGAFDQQ